MRIERVEITVKVDLTGTPDYLGPIERGQQRRFRPTFAMVSPSGDVMVFGHHINGRGEANTRRSSVEYPASQGDAPDFVYRARKLARELRTELVMAWAAWEGSPDRDHQPV